VLSVGAVRAVPGVTGKGAIEVTRRIDLGLACDHRVLDGAQAARVLAAIKEALEEPIRLAGERDG
jgi:pyruvate dehydrogenase E2 component (dihydrolipoamide acetyltransferase)